MSCTPPSGNIESDKRSSSPTVGSVRAASPSPAPTLQMTPGSDRENVSKDAPASEVDNVADPVPDADVLDASKIAPASSADKIITPAPEHSSNYRPATVSTERTLEHPVSEDTPSPESQSSPAASQPPTPPAAKVAEYPFHSTPGNASPPYPTTPPNVDASREKDVKADGSPVQMPPTPEELVEKVVEEMRRKGLVG